MHRTVRGILVPDAGDDLLAAYEKGLDSAGVITKFDSVLALRTALKSAEAAGVGPTPDNKWYADVQGVMYACDGSKSGDVFVVRPVNEVEFSYAGTTLARAGYSLAKDQRRTVTSVTLPTRNYDRVVYANGTAWARVTAGEVFLEIASNGSQRLPGGGWAWLPDRGDMSVSVTALFKVLAGVSCTLSLNIVGGVGNASATGGTAEMQADNGEGLTVISYPTTMA